MIALQIEDQEVYKAIDGEFYRQQNGLEMIASENFTSPAVMEAVGVKDVLSKTFGSSNTINIVRATLAALDQLRDPVAAVERRKGVSAVVTTEDASS